MTKRVCVLIWFAGLYVAGSALAQSEGYLGVYGDALGTVRCPSVPPWVMTTLYVVATTAGASASGITGVEFRIEVVNSNGYFFNYIAPDTAQVLGDPLSATGANVVWPSCRLPDGAAKIALGTIQVFNTGSGGPTDIIIRRREPPTSEHECPLFVLCDAPTYTIHCTTAPADSVSCINR